MRIASVLVAALLFLGSPVALVSAPHAALAAPGELDRARELVKQAQPHLKQAMNPDNAPGDRKKGRKAAYKLLREAQKLFDEHLDSNPGQAETLDSEYCAISASLYWVKKFATLNEFRDDGGRVVELPPVRPPVMDKKGGPTPGGSSKTGELLPEGGETGPAEKEPPVAPVRDPADLRVEQARAVYAALQKEESRRPGDVAHLHALYEKFLGEYDDPSLREYQLAALRFGALADRMKDVLKDQCGFDPDDFDAKDSSEVSRVVKRLSDMLKKGDDADRRRASEILGKLATGAAGYPLARVLFDGDAVVAKNAADGLVAIGGKRVASNLTKLYRDGDLHEQHGALAVLTRICKNGDVDARSVSFAMGRFVLSRDDGVSDAALAGLTGLGKSGVPGLLEGLSTRETDKRLKVIAALGDTGHVPATPRIAKYLLPGSTPRAEQQRDAAMEALKQFGLPAVPYLISALKDPKRKAVIRDALTMLTGQRFSAARPGDWQTWWKRVGSKQVEEK